MHAHVILYELLNATELIGGLACSFCCCCCRDWARFGLCITQGGRNLAGDQILPRDYVESSRRSEAQRETVSVRSPLELR
jgi:hypothetical protein